MPLIFIRQDITKMRVDAIVNAANETLLGGGGVDGAIHYAAGPRLLEECRGLGGCRTGEAKRTLAYRLPCRYVIHTVGPVWHGGDRGEQALLRACYRNSLQIAADSGCESVAFPLISAGVYGYPKAQAIAVAVDAIRDFLQTNDMTVYLVLFDRSSVDAARQRFGELDQYINDHFVQLSHERFGRPDGSNRPPHASFSVFDKPSKARGPVRSDVCCASEPADKDAAPEWTVCADDAAEEMPLPVGAALGDQASLEQQLDMLDESFTEMLLRKIDEKGVTDAECYKRANIDRKHFSKIRKNRLYKPRKETALAFAIALELPLAQTREMLEKAGYALSRSSKFDVIVEFYISRGMYDVHTINEALFAYDQNLLGA